MEYFANRLGLCVRYFDTDLSHHFDSQRIEFTRLNSGTHGKAQVIAEMGEPSLGNLAPCAVLPANE